MVEMVGVMSCWSLGTALWDPSSPCFNTSGLLAVFPAALRNEARWGLPELSCLIITLSPAGSGVITFQRQHCLPFCHLTASLHFLSSHLQKPSFRG